MGWSSCGDDVCSRKELQQGRKSSIESSTHNDIYQSVDGVFIKVGRAISWVVEAGGVLATLRSRVERVAARCES